MKELELERHNQKFETSYSNRASHKDKNELNLKAVKQRKKK